PTGSTCAPAAAPTQPVCGQPSPEHSTHCTTTTPRRRHQDMAEFPVHDETTAPEASRPQLEAAKRRMGFVTTLNGIMASSPELLAGYNTLSELFGKSSLPKDAKHVVWITASV